MGITAEGLTSPMASASSLGFNCIAGIFLFKPSPACGANGCHR